jgi:peptidoglycan hydrolase CwlO-like protein
MNSNHSSSNNNASPHRAIENLFDDFKTRENKLENLNDKLIKINEAIKIKEFSITRLKTLFNSLKNEILSIKMVMMMILILKRL